jgi:hypothetical protein
LIGALKVSARPWLKFGEFFSEGLRIRLKSPRIIQGPDTSGARVVISATKSGVSE